MRANATRVRRQTRCICYRVKVVRILLSVSLCVQRRFPIRAIKTDNDYKKLFFYVSFRVHVSLTRRYTINGRVNGTNFRCICTREFCGVFIHASVRSFRGILFVSRYHRRCCQSIKYFGVILSNSTWFITSRFQRRSIKGGRSQPRLFCGNRHFLTIITCLCVMGQERQLRRVITRLIVIFCGRSTVRFIVIFDPRFSNGFREGNKSVQFVRNLLVLGKRDRILRLFFLFKGSSSSDATLTFNTLGMCFSVIRTCRLPRRRRASATSHCFKISNVYSARIRLRRFSLFFNKGSCSVVFSF